MNDDRAEQRAKQDEKLLENAPWVSTTLGIPTRTIYALAAKGELPGVKIGNAWRFPRKKILALAGLDDAA